MASVITTVAGLDMHYEVVHPRAEKTLVLLHGFTGSTKTWQHVIGQLGDDVRIFAIDLMGHGLTASPKALDHYTMEAQLEMLEQFFASRNLSSFTLLGYSMGGRTALAYAVTHPERIEKLILESASPGLEDSLEREKRRGHDNYLAERILNEGMREFIDYWQSIPLFQSQSRLSDDMKAEVRAERLAQQELGLANSLRGMGTGSQSILLGCTTSIPASCKFNYRRARPKILLKSNRDAKTFPKLLAPCRKWLWSCNSCGKSRTFCYNSRERILIY